MSWIKYYPSPIAIPLLVISVGLSMGTRGPIVSTMAPRIFSGPNFGGIYGSGGVGAATGAWPGGPLQDIFHRSDALLIFFRHHDSVQRFTVFRDLRIAPAIGF